jgi:uncharacterized membrane protein
MAKRLKSDSLYNSVFFDRMLLTGVIFLAVAYITRDTWAGAFTEAAAVVVGVIWSYRAMTTNASVVFRLLATLVLVLLGSLLAFYLGAAHGLLG